MNRCILNQLKRTPTTFINNNKNSKIINTIYLNHFNNKNIIYRNFSNSIDNNNDNKPKFRISKELESLGVYYSSEENNTEFTEDYEENEDEDVHDEKEDQTVQKQYHEHFQKLNQEDLTQFGNFEEYLQNGKKFQDMIYRIKDNFEQSQVERKRLSLEDLEFESFEDLEKKIEKKMADQYEEKEKKLSTLTESDFLDYDKNKVEVFNKVSDSFISAKTHFETPFENTEKRLESNQIKDLPEGIDNMMTDGLSIDQRGGIASRISKIKQKISKEKLNVNRISGEDLNELFSLYREDPINNNAESLSKKYNVNQKSIENLLKYTTIPIIVKYNTGLKTGHWNVVFEK
ncbi:hypothetical protein DICPUDRAFT_90989 [Dictyostelium purpureum]|uniref:Uncharacterized protein n=1 Tax=Dictyostelium purpureum TaxID=5786 RepID=F1A693_DICPU|nr:uncharacterized protein DICPUDRAFT_90989 [Dictyostelium purpureum]EGC28289.1 hypothetical protein DICPUDRAFT_90989 [Dictyostelium purpureum]|eukprot:XP_003295187.1 hypothetical protein DICPUDRAFT_90989 [Dictyostelium purpureum]